VKYFSEVEQLFLQYPGRRFRAFQITRSVAKDMGRISPSEAIRVGVNKVLREMEQMGTIRVWKSSTKGGFNVYARLEKAPKP